jgi:putative transcriptional regulator
MGAKRIKQRELARLTGLSVVTVGQIYNDKWKQIGRDTLSKLCLALNCSVSDLLEYSPDPE